MTIRTIDVVEAENRFLRARVDLLEELNRQMREEMIAPPQDLAWLPPLTAMELKALRVLARRAFISRESFMLALYGEDGPDQKIMDVWICKLRRKLKPIGASIETIWGRGYSLDAGTRAALNSTARSEAA